MDGGSQTCQPSKLPTAPTWMAGFRQTTLRREQEERPPEVVFLRGVVGEDAGALVSSVLDAISDDPQLVKVLEHLMTTRSHVR